MRMFPFSPSLMLKDGCRSACPGHRATQPRPDRRTDSSRPSRSSMIIDRLASDNSGAVASFDQVLYGLNRDSHLPSDFHIGYPSLEDVTPPCTSLPAREGFRLKNRKQTFRRFLHLCPSLATNRCI